MGKSKTPKKKKKKKIPDSPKTGSIELVETRLIFFFGLKGLVNPQSFSLSKTTCINSVIKCTLLHTIIICLIIHHFKNCKMFIIYPVTNLCFYVYMYNIMTQRPWMLQMFMKRVHSDTTIIVNIIIGRWVCPRHPKW